MRRKIAALFACLFSLCFSAPLLAKEKTTKITVRGTDLRAPIEISDVKLLEIFRVWAGPGTSSDEKQSLIIDWSRGPVTKPPASFRRYQVSFHVGPEAQIAYVVFYALNPGGQQGYVYLPGGSSDDWAALNVGSILHGVEGKWFYAWSAWERVARPLIEGAGLAPSNRPATAAGPVAGSTARVSRGSARTSL